MIKAIKENEQGRSTDEICRELGIHRATFYNWRKKYGGMDVNQVKRLKELEDENRRLKQMYADLSLDNQMLKDVLSKKW
jgi:putative transposase